MKRRLTDAVLSVAALAYKRKPGLLDWLGWCCLVVGAALLAGWVAWVVAGVGLLLKATDWERRQDT